MRKCVNPACLADFAFDDSMTNCPFCHSRLESCGGTDAPPLVPPLDYGIPGPSRRRNTPLSSGSWGEWNAMAG